jgi:hypothetical protein
MREGTKSRREKEWKRKRKKGERGAYWRISSIDIFAALESEWVDSVRISSTLALISNSSGTIWDVSRGVLVWRDDNVEVIDWGGENAAWRWRVIIKEWRVVVVVIVLSTQIRMAELNPTLPIQDLIGGEQEGVKWRKNSPVLPQHIKSYNSSPTSHKHP